MISTSEHPHRPLLSLGHPAVITPDLDRFRRFYEDVIGLRLVAIHHPSRAAYRRVGSFTDATGAAVVLVAYEIPRHRTDLADDLLGRHGRIDHLVFVVDDVDALTAAAGRLIDAGASSGAIGPLHSLEFVDPDGAHHVVQVAGEMLQPAPHIEFIAPTSAPPPPPRRQQ